MRGACDESRCIAHGAHKGNDLNAVHDETNCFMKIPFTGGCMCGAIRYECTAEPIMTFKCHCRDCQRVTGGGFVAGLLVPASAFRLTKGQLRYHFTPSAAGGRHKRGFCADWAKAVRAKDIDGGMSLHATNNVSFDLDPPLRYTGADNERRA